MGILFILAVIISIIACIEYVLSIKFPELIIPAAITHIIAITILSILVIIEDYY